MKHSLLTLLIFLCLSAFLEAQEQNKDHVSGTQANNPLANMTALNIQNYYVPRLTDAQEDAYLNTFWLRYAKPFSKGKLLLRVSVPFNTVAFPDDTGLVSSENGLGDINALFTYNFISKPTATVGVGPVIIAPTAANDFLGSGKWQVGLALVAFVVKSREFQLGGLVTWQTSVAGDDNREGTNSAIIQPFYFWQLGKGTYLRGAPAWFFNIKNDAYSVPFALGIGKVIKVGNTVFNCFIEPQYSMLHKGTQPQFQIFAGINLQFLK
ncbi:hypothetical protein DFQ05_0501 [Winogradskyella wandonensis]|uniref:Neuromedin U n=1 Tax=Winogradskyella wandonensis TaxID=1442586 RepID=A0A4R1KW90_9FLAO|nr:hypothetical protein [Winogradskyella wandonensis]TCK68990.1 hypothetical protein DFQ05_0501 [Winogradskyella wandonensis]